MTEYMGRGVRTTRDFSKDEVLSEYSGDLVETYAESQRREKQYTAAGLLSGGFMYGFHLKGKQYWLVLVFLEAL